MKPSQLYALALKREKSKASKHLYFGSEGALHEFSIPTRKITQTWPTIATDWVSSLAATSDKKYLFIGHRSGQLQ
jgi:WD40 repeat protein